MIDIGQYHRLEVVKEVDFGLYLAADEDEILLPLKYIPSGTQVGDLLNVFVYNDSEGRPIATTLTPHACVGEFAYLRAVDSNSVGTFLDWGIAKDILVPFKEQAQPMVVGKSYVVYVYLDDITNRVLATSKWNRFVSIEPIENQEGDAVDLLIAERTDLGYKAIINNTHLGLLYENEVFGDISIGENRIGYIKTIRPDGKIDLRLQPSGRERVAEGIDRIIHLLQQNGGKLPLGDKSDPEDIYYQLNISKKAFKKAIGGLYKENKITISDHEIKLV